MERHHHRVFLFSLLAVVIGCALAGGGFWAYWNFYARFRPVTITKNQAEIQRLLDAADWVSPHRAGAPIYLLGYRSCGACVTYQKEEFPKLAAANVDTRVIVFARPDREGLAQSSVYERTTVAELWINRNWDLHQRWLETPKEVWAASGVPQADGDWARTAVVDATRSYVDKLAPLLKANGVPADYPLLIWRDREGFLKVCSCTDRRSYHFIRADLGAPDQAPPAPAPLPAAAPAVPATTPAPAEPAATPAAASAPAAAAPVASGAPVATPATPAAPSAKTATPAAKTTAPAAAATKRPGTSVDASGKNVFY